MMDFNRYVGIPYRDPDDESTNGLHCWELVELVMREEFGLEPPKVKFSENYKLASAVFMSELERWKFVRTGDEQAGDMVLFSIAGHECHCGIIIDKAHMLHCLKGRDTTIERYRSPEWLKRTVGFYRWQS